jgi:hypothetical protein
VYLSHFPWNQEEITKEYKHTISDSENGLTLFGMVRHYVTGESMKHNMFIRNKEKTKLKMMKLSKIIIIQNPNLSHYHTKSIFVTLQKK